MKVGILTFHCAHNYGAVLQAYALQEYLKSLGHEIEIIDYRPLFLVEAYSWFSLRRFRSRNPIKVLVKLYTEMFLLSARKKRYLNFNQFIITKLELSDRVSDIIPDKYDLIIVGSDQVWNTRLGKSFYPLYWGNFDRKPGCRLISYAASMEESCLNNDEDRLKVQTYLRNFDAISVREQQLASSLSSLYSRDIVVSLDPTLLVDRKVWYRLAAGEVPEEKYLLLYQVRNSPQALLIAENIASNMGLKVITLSARVDLDNTSEYISSSPSAYVNLFKNASFVVTTSFHGTAFSIIFNIPFYAILLNDGMDSRTVNLLNMLNLRDRGLNSSLPLDELTIDWEKVNKSINILHELSAKYLQLFLRQ